MSRNIKIGFRFFTVPEWRDEEKYLRQMHNMGWSFRRLFFPGLYVFDACEPEDVVYQLDYNSDGLAHKREYVQMFYDCGWEYLTDFGGYSYFRKPVSHMTEGGEEIFCDEASRFDMIRRVYKGRMVPMIVIFCCCILPQLFLQFYRHDEFSTVMFWLFAVCFVLYLGIFLRFGIMYFRYKNELK